MFGMPLWLQYLSQQSGQGAMPVSTPPSPPDDSVDMSSGLPYSFGSEDIMSAPPSSLPNAMPPTPSAPPPSSLPPSTLSTLLASYAGPSGDPYAMAARDPGMSAGGGGSVQPLIHPFHFDDSTARGDARNAGMAALTGGLLNSYLDRGQHIGDAFTAQQKAVSDTYDSARKQALEDWQSNVTASRENREVEAGKYLEQDRAAQAKERQALADKATAQSKIEASNAVGRQAIADATTDPTYKAALQATVNDPVRFAEIHIQMLKQQEPNLQYFNLTGANGDQRWSLDPRTGEKKLIATNPVKPFASEVQTPAELRAEERDKRMQIEFRANEIAQENIAALGSHARNNPALIADAHARARHQAELEADNPTGAVPAGAQVRGSSKTLTPNVEGAGKVALTGDASGPSAAGAKPVAAPLGQATTKPNATTTTADPHAATAIIDTVAATNPSLAAKIAIARSHHYTDEQIKAQLNL